MLNDSLCLIRPLEWNEVFALWREGEAAIPRWIEHYQRRGFPSWDDWRKHTLKDVRYDSLSWNLFLVERPTQTVSEFFGGPFRVWIKDYYDNAQTRTFAELAGEPKVENNAIVKEMVANFPAATNLIALETGARIFIVEGMHRCCALALAQQQGKNLESNVFLALASYPGNIPLMGSPDSPT